MTRYLVPFLLANCYLSGPAFADDMENMKGMQHDISQMHMQSSPNAQSKPYDQQFLDTMMHHHMMAMDMAKMAQPKATHPELKAMIQKMLDQQKKEMDELKALKEQLYSGKGDAINMGLPGVASTKNMDMDSLMSASEEEFDRKFIDMMTKHHKSGIALAQSEVNKGKQSEVKSLAKKIIQSQEKDITEMSKMKAKWQQSS